MEKEKTEVISFRVPEDVAELLNKRAKRLKKRRADYVKDIVLPILIDHIFYDGKGSPKSSK